jgi:hypothetical protein
MRIVTPRTVFWPLDAYPRAMKPSANLNRSLCLLLIMMPFTALPAATKPHIINFGRWIAVQWVASTQTAPVTMRIRPLLVDGRVKEYVVGPAHEITDRSFVVQRVFRVNDGLPDESAPRWQWQRGGWLLVDRVTGRISPANLPAFDAYFSAASWYRDYVAYCGVGDDSKKAYVVVAQIGRRKPVLKKLLPTALNDDAGPDSICPAPLWQRSPVRVSFAPETGDRQTFSIRGTAVDFVDDTEDDD